MSHICIIIEGFTTLTLWRNVWLCALFVCITQLLCPGMWWVMRMANCSTKVWSQKAFFSNATKNKHDNNCGTSFDKQQCFDSKQF